MSEQLILDLYLPQPPSFEGFVPGENAEPLFMLAEWAAGAADIRFLYLWGGDGVGKSYLLDAAASRLAGALYINAARERLPDFIDPAAALIVDNVEALDPEQQIRLFDHYNTLREGSGRLLAAGPLPPMQLDLRDDLTTRLGWGLVYQLKALSDADKIAALKAQAREAGFELPTEVADYLLRHTARDLASLRAVLEQANRYALSTKRPVTVPLIRDVLAGDRHV
ncbi:DnaA regulatory inactivator Hda [Silvimonas iriomotensis]|uniref:DnaA regulatory inactivator Hda n=1 Tax=Silvimonas iriomotensis TaxID=449662 RepID=A0ABQ2PD62_9NEIS|nr:DnaA regulatory inactivator Hda [Silvimonas iriomotensis]GGP23488.1 DnaA regulatory inactivator Hda [Silvimonas iriomotensis]